MHGIQQLDFPPYSPDLNPIENLWDNLKRRVEKRNPTNLEELEDAINEEWRLTDVTFLHTLVESMQRRCEAVKENNGHLSHY